MEIINRTPFAPLFFENQDVDGDDFYVFVLKGTFDFTHGLRAKPSRNQLPLVLADEYRGEDPLRSSVRVESDVIPMKQNAEVTLDAIARSPGNVPTQSWPVSVQVGSVRKDLRVMGPRVWRFGLLTGWKLTKPEPVHKVPLHYELSFGGSYVRDDEDVVYEQNPAGKGFYDWHCLDTRLEYAAPQIEAMNKPLMMINQRLEPEGFGPIAKHWLPRRELCGTADAQWKATRWPKLPLDFDTDYFNGAPYDLVNRGFFKGDELVRLVGTDANGPVEFSLPNLTTDLLVTDVDDYQFHVAMNLDTVHIATEQRQLTLVWRGTFLKLARLSTLEATVSGPGVRYA